MQGKISFFIIQLRWYLTKREKKNKSNLSLIIIIIIKEKHVKSL